jgi:dTDP-glucose pyrophosphorylase
MIAWAIESLVGVSFSQIVFVALAEHERRYGVTKLVRHLAGREAEVILLEDVTEGQLCTVLAARVLIDNDEDLLIASADTYVVSNFGSDIAHRACDCRGIISVADVAGDRWSFARTDEIGRVVEVAEKVRISDHASTGLYYFTSGREFVEVAEEMIANNEKIRGEYYVIPVYKTYLRRGWPVHVSVAKEMWDMGTPTALEEFENHLRFRGRCE